MHQSWPGYWVKVVLALGRYSAVVWVGVLHYGLGGVCYGEHCHWAAIEREEETEGEKRLERLAHQFYHFGEGEVVQVEDGYDGVTRLGDCVMSLTDPAAMSAALGNLWEGVFTSLLDRKSVV